MALASLLMFMGTLLLVGETLRNPLSEPDGPPARRGPSLRAALERVGYDVVEAEDAAGALARVGQQSPDLIVLAGTVPDTDLVDVCTALRHDAAAEKTPLVLVVDAARRKGRAASLADLVFPPTIGPVEIADRLRRLF